MTEIKCTKGPFEIIQIFFLLGMHPNLGLSSTQKDKQNLYRIFERKKINEVNFSKKFEVSFSRSSGPQAPELPSLENYFRLHFCTKGTKSVVFYIDLLCCSSFELNSPPTHTHTHTVLESPRLNAGRHGRRFPDSDP